MTRAMRLLILFATACSWGCSGSTPNPVAASSTSTSNAVNPTSVAVSGMVPLTRANQTVQLTATVTFSNGTTQDVTSSATWQSSGAGVATVSTDGVVTALTSGSVTITASYRGVSGTVAATVSIATPTQNPRSSMTAIVDGVAWNSVVTLALKTPLPTDPTGVVGVSGTNGFSGAYIEIAFGVPATVGTYTLSRTSIANVGLQIPGNAASWVSSASGSTGTITLSTLTAAGASGTFSMTLAPLTGTKAVGNKVITNGVLNVTF